MENCCPIFYLPNSQISYRRYRCSFSSDTLNIQDKESKCDEVCEKGSSEESSSEDKDESSSSESDSSSENASSPEISIKLKKREKGVKPGTFYCQDDI